MVPKNYQWHNTIQGCSMERNGNFYQKVYTKFQKQRYHNDCYCTYKSREKIARYLKKRKLDLNTRGLDSPSDKMLRR